MEFFEEMKANNIFNDLEVTKIGENLLNEIKNLKLCSKSNNNIVKFYEYYDTEEEFVIVMELCDNNLKHFLFERKNGLNKNEIKEIIMQLNNAFRIMVDNKIIHRDLKLENILIKYINEDKTKYSVKLADYGVSKKLNTLAQKCRTHAGTLITMAPEILKDEDYDNRCDLWSLGIIIYQLFFKELPYKSSTEIGLINQIEKYGQTLLKKTNDKFLDNLISKLLVSEPIRRITWEEYFNHPFCKNLIENY